MKRKESSRDGVIKTCPFCGEEFVPKRSDQVYCKEKCRDAAKWERIKPVFTERVCPICGKAFMPSRNNHVCCSSKCGFRKIYLENPEKHKQQSKEWRENNIERVKENDRRKREQNKELYKQIDSKNHDETRFGGNRQKALERDGYKCVLCGATENLAVHHKDESGQTDNPNHELDNLVTVCSSCHTKQHNPRLNTTPHVINTCLICGIEFRVSQARVDINRGKYCSKECANKAKETSVEITCQHCNKEFQVTPSRLKRGKVKYCSMECRKQAGYAWTNKDK
jgi:5-methylcytosine-specific restriction endonuclease McrA